MSIQIYLLKPNECQALSIPILKYSDREVEGFIFYSEKQLRKFEEYLKKNYGPGIEYSVKKITKKEYLELDLKKLILISDEE